MGFADTVLEPGIEMAMVERRPELKIMVRTKTNVPDHLEYIIKIFPVERGRKRNFPGRSGSGVMDRLAGPEDMEKAPAEPVGEVDQSRRHGPLIVRAELGHIPVEVKLGQGSEDEELLPDEGPGELGAVILEGIQPGSFKKAFVL